MGKSIHLNRWHFVMAFLIAFGMQQKSPLAATGPCDIYAAGGTPCVAAYSTVRALSSTYTGPLYQVRKAGGGTKDISDTNGFANSAAQDAFCGTDSCSISILYDQSGKGNNLIKAPAGCYTGTASLPDNESNAKARSLMVNGHKVYALYMIPQDGYRNNTTTGMPTGSQAEGIYEIADGKRYGGACCWDFGNGSTNNCSGGTGNMAALYFGTSYWGNGAGKGPWFMADLEAGVWAGGSNPGDPGWGALSGAHPANPNSPSETMDYAFGILKNNATNYAIRVGDAQSGNLTTAFDGNVPSVLHWTLNGAVLLGIGGDNSNSSYGTFFEGAITSGRPADSTDAAVLKNVQAAGYGSSASAVHYDLPSGASPASRFQISYHPSLGNAVIRYTLDASQRVTLNVFDHRGKVVARLVDGVAATGNHQAVWNANRVSAGIYIVSLAIDGHTEWAGKIAVSR